MSKDAVIRPRQVSGLPDPKRRAQIRKTCEERAATKKHTRVSLYLDDGDPLLAAATARGVQPSHVLGDAISKNLDVLGDAAVTRFNRPNGTHQESNRLALTVHWLAIEPLWLAADAVGLSVRVACEVLLRATLLEE